MTNDQYEWYQKLPRTPISQFSLEVECDCGALLLVEIDPSDKKPSNPMQIGSWVDRHFEHRGERPDIVSGLPEVITNGYDLTKRIKFTKEGFPIFIEQFELKYVPNSVAPITGYHVGYKNKAGQLFGFFEAWSDSNARRDMPDVHMIYDPEYSKL